MRWASRPDAIAAGAYLDTLDFKFAVGEHLAKTAVEIPHLYALLFTSSRVTYINGEWVSSPLTGCAGILWP